MKLIKIGSTSACDVQLASSYVSSSHAEMTLLDTGEIILEDLNSTNGTFVNGIQIKPNNEVAVRRGDRIRFADIELVWSRIPSLPSNSGYTQIINIGTNYRNEVQINSGTVSRFHATLKVDKKGRAFLVDNGSKNGTKVNGEKIQKDTPYQIKKGDNIILGNEDVTDAIQHYVPTPSKLLGSLLVSMGVVAVLAAIAYIVHPLFDMEPGEKSVVHVVAEYHYEITLSDTPEEFEGLTFRYPEKGELMYEGTAFFIDQDGHLATNRHITHPWDSRSTSVDNDIKKYVGTSLHNMFGSLDIATIEQFNAFSNTEIGEAICEYVIKRYPASERLVQLNTLLRRIRTSALNIKGVHNKIAIGYAGQMFNSFSEYHPCTVIADSKEKEKDVAIIRLNTMKTPEEIEIVFDINNVSTKKLVPMKDDLRVIGYPNGYWKAHATTITLQPTIVETKCSKVPEKYVFECQVSSAKGASGSPVFIKGTNTLVGILNGGFNTTDGGITCVQARYLKELYDKECR